MAMNKKEQAHVELLERTVREARALRFTETVRRDVPPPKQGTTTGFVAVRQSYGKSGVTVEFAWSSCVSHGYGKLEEGKTRSGRQNPNWLYSTPLLALRGLRNVVEKECAEQLASIDAAIEQELNKEAADHGERQ